MAAVVNGSRRLLTRSSTTLVLLPARPRPTSLAGLAAAHPSTTPVSLSNSSSFLFSTTSAVQAKGTQQHIRAGRKSQSVKKKNKGPARAGKPILPGERKAYRKRIVLSNSNAIDVPGLESLQPQDLAVSDPVSNPNIGRMLALPDALVDQLRAIESFKATQNFQLFKKPSLLLRSDTVALTARIQSEVGEQKKTVRVVVDGERIAGKSTLLQHAQAQGFLNEWLVFAIPEAQELTTACTEYAPVPKSDPLVFTQPNATYKILQTALAANGSLLDKYTTSRAYDDLVNPVPAGSTFTELINAAKEPDHAWPVWQALWSEICNADAGLPRPRVMFTLDGLAHIMRISDYRSPAFELIHSHDLLLVRFFVDALAGNTKFPHGAAILAATTYGNTPLNPTLDLAMAQRTAEQKLKAAKAGDGTDITVPQPEPYFRHYDDRVSAAMKNVEVMTLKGLNRTEARALLEYWAASGLLRERIDEAAVAQSLMLSGNGVVGEMERVHLLSLRA
ncbi:hypothetical protein Sste5346_005354 [Sporothrix stenoceras]|uniref:Small ribosomal subunit protein mS29 n=1 Tax=Sporothrix stenoceras TaxID=5173 RepID=A0ABR3Z3J7_9PEZI